MEAPFLWGPLLGRTCLNPPVLSVIMRIVSGAWIFVREDFCYICCTLQVIIVTYLFRLLAPADPYATVTEAIGFLRATAGTAIARLSHRNSVCPSVCHTGGSGKNGAN